MAGGVSVAQVGAERVSLSLRRPNGHRPRLLLAEDSDPVRIVTAAMLKGMGCDVEAVVHGEEAVESAISAPFDVIVLDIEMPVMDGITAARSIRKLGGAASATPIMALSAFLADAMQSASWRDTFDIALPKPANKNELHAAVEAALNWQARQPSAGAIEKIPLVSSDQMSVLKGAMSPAVLRELLAIACRDIDDGLVQLGRPAIAGNVQRCRPLAGKMRGLGRTFAAPRLVLAARNVEQAGSAAELEQRLACLASTAEATVAALRAI